MFPPLGIKTIRMIFRPPRLLIILLQLGAKTWHVIKNASIRTYEITSRKLNMQHLYPHSELTRNVNSGE